MKTITGYIGKHDYKEFLEAIESNDMSKIHYFMLGGFCKNKGQEHQWEKVDWPPVKVKLTMEIVE